jgi:hypothetical protein
MPSVNTRTSRPRSGRERAEVTTDPVHEQIDGVGRLAGGTREQVAHGVAHARHAEGSGSMVEKIGDLVDAHAALAGQIEYHAGIDGSGPCSALVGECSIPVV